MMQRVILILCFSANFAFGQQQLPNYGFENWEKPGEKSEPIGWNSLTSAQMCSFCSFGVSQRVFRDITDLHSGNASVRIESTSAFGGVIVNGTVTTGRIVAPSVIPSKGYNQSILNNDEFHLAFTSQPDSLVFWAKYSIDDSSDSALVSFLIHDEFEMTDPPREGSDHRAMAFARRVFQTNSQWQRVSVPFEYGKVTRSKSLYLLATFSASYKAGKGNANATLWIDDVQLIYNSLAQSSAELTLKPASN